MLQQTQVTTVLPYYQRFLASFPDAGSLARATIDDVLAHWSGLGYYRRAHHLHAAARRVMEMHGGRFPRDAATLETLPGIGRSTAAAIVVFSSGARAAILDGNVKRVLARHAGIEGWPGAPKVEAALWAIAQERLPLETATRGGDIEAYTQGMMDLGATVCTRAQPRCGACPVAPDCVARREGRIDSLPSPRPARVLPHRELRVLVIERDGRVLFERRPAQGVWGGLWSLPECALDDDARAMALMRFGIVAGEVRALPVIEHTFTHFTLTMHPLRLTTTAEAMRACANDAFAWLTSDAAERAGLPSPIRRLVRSLDPAGFLLAPPPS